MGFLNRPAPWVSWRKALLLAALPALILLFIIFLLEPSGTDRYSRDSRSIRLFGYALCIIGPTLLMHAIERWWYRSNEQVRKNASFIAARMFGVIIMVTAAYFYNISVIHQLPASWTGWFWFLLHIGLPYAILLTPGLIYLEYRLAGSLTAAMLEGAKPLTTDAANAASPGSAQRLSLRGRNAGDLLEMDGTEFLYAEALQNYVAVHFLNGAAIDKRMLRCTLTELEAQIPLARRIHRSYLINPLHLQAVTGGRRKRRATLAHVSETLPLTME